MRKDRLATADRQQDAREPGRGTEVEGSSGSAADRGGSTTLRFHRVTKRFGSVVAVRDLTLDMVEGELHGVVGENGAGKSTLVGIATATHELTSGSVEVLSTALDGTDPRVPLTLGLAAVRQDPALFPDMSVAENLWLKAPASHRPPRSRMRAWARGVLDRGIAPDMVDERALCSDLSVELRYTVELAAALALDPKVLILDEPTEHLGADLVATLFDRLRLLRSAGCSIMYISHRLRDVQDLSDRISVMRDGRLVGTFGAQELSMDEMVAHIAGRPVDAIFPARRESGREAADPVLTVGQFSGPGFQVDAFALRPGEVVGLAGIEGNGQRDFLRALARLTPARGDYRVEGARFSGGRRTANRARIEYVPRDRRGEALFETLSVGENLQVDRAAGVTTAGFIRDRAERRVAQDVIDRFGIRTPSPRTPVSSMSGGNAQKTVLARALSRNPRILLLDEPTQGVDVGAREDIYRLIRRAVDDGAAVVIAGSDAAELEGLCDRVLVFARGSVAAELTGADATEYNIVSAAVTAKAEHRDASDTQRRQRRAFTIPRPVLLLVLNVVLAVGVQAGQPLYLSNYNINFLLLSLVPLGFAAMAQQAMLLVGGIDLSVGGVAGLMVVAASSLLAGPALGSGIAVFLLVAVVVVVVVAIVNRFLGDTVGLTPFIGTLATFVVLEAVLLTLRPAPSGTVDFGLVALVQSTIGPVPILLLACVVVGVVLQTMLTRTVWGTSVRGVGGAEDVGRTIGMRTGRLRLSAYVLAAALAAVAGVTLLAQTQTGTSTIGLNYTFSSVTAAVIGGASLLGGRGSFLSTLLGAALLQQALSATTFLGLGDAPQYYFVGGLIIVAAVLNSGRAGFAAVLQAARSSVGAMRTSRGATR